MVIENDSGIVGLIGGGTCREAGEEFWAFVAELYVLYLLKEVQGYGYGKLLFNHLTVALKQRYYTSMMLWVLEDNPSIGFYRHLGGQFITKKEIQIGDVQLSEVALGWSKI